MVRNVGIKGSLAWHLMVEKVNLVLLKSLLHSLVGYIIEKDGIDKTYDVLKELGKKAGKWIIMHYFEKTKPVADTVKDYWKAANLGIKIFSGQELDEIFYEVLDGGKRVLLRLRSRKNPICKGIISPDPRIKFSAFIAGIFEWIQLELKKDIYGFKEVRVDETKCLTTGDDFCEITIEWIFDEERAKDILKLFKTEGIHRVK